MVTNHERKLTDVKHGIHTSLVCDSIGLLLKTGPDGKAQGYLTASRFDDNNLVIQPVTNELYDYLHQCIEGLSKGFLQIDLKRKYHYD